MMERMERKKSYLKIIIVIIIFQIFNPFLSFLLMGIMGLIIPVINYIIEEMVLLKIYGTVLFCIHVTMWYLIKKYYKFDLCFEILIISILATIVYLYRSKHSTEFLNFDASIFSGYITGTFEFGIFF